MELEFDKEMDAILRKARVGRGVLVGDDPPQKPPGKHLDADAIAAFAENALPAKVRELYMPHLADCDRCRRVLSGLMMLNSEAATEKASAIVPAPVVEAAIPWYQKLFKTPNLALAMGALVLVFGGFLGFLALREGGSSDTSVAVVTDQERTGGGPFARDEVSGTAAANSAAPVQPNTNAAVAAPSSVVANKPAAPAEPTPESSATARKDEPAKTEGAVVGKSSGGEDNEVREQPKSKAAPEPVAAPPAGGVPAREEEKADDRVASKKAAPSDEDERSKRAATRRSRDAPPPSATKGPARSGPLNSQQNQIATQNMADMTVERKVGGKTFHNRDGAWYDSAYKNQATMNFRRGTDEYKGLEAGIRNIADALGGTVVLVWKEKAYRIR